MKSILPFLGTTLLAIIAGFLGFLMLQSNVENPVVRNPKQTIALEQTTSSSTPARIIPPQRPDIFYEAIIDRPLFAIARRPIKIEPLEIIEDTEFEPDPDFTPEDTIQQDTPEPEIQLMGVMTGGAKSSALISIQGAEPEWFKEGSDIQGWVLDMINPENIRITESDRAINIELYRK